MMKFKNIFKSKLNFAKLIGLLVIGLLIVIFAFVEIYSPIYIHNFEDLDVKSEVDRVGGDFFKDNGDEMYYADYKKDDAKDTILLIHGFGGSSFSWRKIIPALTTNYHVISFDLLGFGMSKVTQSKDIGLNRSEEIISKFIADKKLTNITIVAHSLGGQVAQKLAIDHPKEVLSLVLINSVDGSNTVYNDPDLSFWQWSADFPLVKNPVMWSVLANIKTSVNRAYYDKTLIDKLTYEGYEKGFRYKGSVDQFVKFAKSPLPDKLDLSRLKQMTLIYSAENDQVISKDKQLDLSKKIPESHLISIPNAGHLLMEEQPELVVEGIGKWIEQAHEKQLQA